MEVTMHDAPGPGRIAEAPSKGTYKSYKKKYHKMRAHFETTMKESNKLFKEEQKIMDIARRLQEQNDLLQELVLGLNDSVATPSDLRYRLDASDPIRTAEYITATQSVLQDIRRELAADEISAEDYHRVTTDIYKSDMYGANKSLRDLETIPHSALDATFDPASNENISAGYLTPSHEESYLFDLDSRLDENPTVAVNLLNDPPTKAPERAADRERDLNLRNPVSVYNWLRKNQPQVFLQDNETTSEKASGRGGNPRNSKRGSAAVKQEPELYDEDGFAMQVESSGRGKRKRDDEPYRPKGGSSRGSKRKRDDGHMSGRRGKKASISDQY